jgi:hypothetical protein
VSPRVPAAPGPLPVSESFGIAMCPITLSTPFDMEGLRCRHVSRGSKPASRYGRALASPRATKPATQQGRAPVLPRVSWLQTRLPMWEGSGVATCHRDCHPTGKGSGVATCPAAPDPSPGVGGLWCHHIPRGSQPLRHAHAFPRRLTSDSSWPHQARGAGSALNAYKISHTLRMASLKCIQDIDTAEQ